jgi:hypothetical protein
MPLPGPYATHMKLLSPELTPVPSAGAKGQAKGSIIFDRIDGMGRMFFLCLFGERAEKE